jgi:hypothetical protein
MPAFTHKPLRFALLALAAALIFAAGWWTRSPSTEILPAASGPSSAPPAPSPDTRERETLHREIRDLRAQLSALRANADQPSSPAPYTPAPSRHSTTHPLENLVRYDASARVLQADAERDVVIPGEGKILLGRAAEITRSLRSTESVQTAALSFENQRSEDVYLFWVDFRGKPVFQGRLPPGRTANVGTFLSHPFVVTDLQGRRLGEGSAEQPGEVATIVIEP